MILAIWSVGLNRTAGALDSELWMCGSNMRVQYECPVHVDLHAVCDMPWTRTMRSHKTG
jgi:hypothetical protein